MHTSFGHSSGLFTRLTGFFPCFEKKQKEDTAVEPVRQQRPTVHSQPWKIHAREQRRHGYIPLYWSSRRPKQLEGSCAPGSASFWIFEPLSSSAHRKPIAATGLLGGVPVNSGSSELSGKTLFDALDCPSQRRILRP